MYNYDKYKKKLNKSLVEDVDSATTNMKSKAQLWYLEALAKGVKPSKEIEQAIKELPEVGSIRLNCYISKHSVKNNKRYAKKCSFLYDFLGLGR